MELGKQGPSWDNMSTQEEIGPRKARMVLRYKKQGALNEYDYQYCKYLVNSELQPLLRKVKDKSNMYYKRVEVLCDPTDLEYTPLTKMFGYKCKLVRDPADTQYMMEVMVPILVDIGKRKVA